MNALCQIILDVIDLERSIGFYGGMLGLAVEERTRVEGCRMATLKTGGTKIVLVQQPHPELQYDRTGGVVLDFCVSSLTALQSRLAHLGCQTLRPLERDPCGKKSILVADPDGYAILISESTSRVH